MGRVGGGDARLHAESGARDERRRRQRLDREFRAQAAARVEGGGGPACPVSNGVDEGEIQLEALARRHLGRGEGDQQGAFARGDVDDHRFRKPRAPAIAVGVETDPDLGTALGITIDGRPRRSGAVDDCDLFSRREGAARYAKCAGKLGRDEPGGLSVDPGRLAQDSGRIARGGGIPGLGFGPVPERIRQHEERAAVDDARFADLEDELETLVARCGQTRCFSGVPAVAIARGFARRCDGFEPDASRRVGGVVRDLPLGEGHPVDFGAGVGGEGRVLLRPVRRQLEPGRLGQDRLIQLLFADARSRLAAGILGLLIIPALAGLAAERQQATDEHRSDPERVNADRGRRRVPEGVDSHPATGPSIRSSS